MIGDEKAEDAGPPAWGVEVEKIGGGAVADNGTGNRPDLGLGKCLPNAHAFEDLLRTMGQCNVAAVWLGAASDASLSFSMTTTLKPAAEARAAHERPAGPPPMIAMS